jgi:Flp pilus assembly protein TadB
MLLIALASVSALSAVGFAFVCLLWMRTLKERVAVALREAARQQITTSQRMAETLAEIQKQQKGYQQQLVDLYQAHKNLRDGLVTVANRVDIHHSDAIRGNVTLH